jgi:hypothetical protein
MCGNNVSFTASFFQNAAMADFAVLPFIGGALALTALAALVMLFRPLLTGIARALVLVVRPRLSRDEKAARRQMRDAQLFQRMINTSQGPNDAAELRAMAARG